MSGHTNASSPAFPPFLHPDSRDGQGMPTGLTKRELFAALAMQGILTHSNAWDEVYIAKTAVRHADALIVALSETHNDVSGDTP